MQLFLKIAGAFLLVAVSSSFAIKLKPAFTVKFKKPIFMVEYPYSLKGKRQFLVIEQRGVAYMVDQASAKKRLVFDMRSKVCDQGWEEGLLGIALDPGFTRNRQIYIYYSTCSPKYVNISRLTFGKVNPHPVKMTEEVLLRIKQPYGNHNGGMIAFGPDGFLYLGVGDGGSGGDPHNYGQNKKSLLGKILRIDVNTRRGYKVPPSNPYYRGGGRKEIYAIGLRNPWRFSFDKLTGDLYVGDVGQNKYEEISIVQKGQNHGWRIKEGFHCYKPAKNCNRPGLTDPIYEYSHNVGQSVVGGYIYRGRQLKNLVGKYIFADTMSGRVWYLHRANLKTDQARQLLKSGLMISSFAEDNQGELYLLDLKSGRIFQLVN